MFVRYYFTGNSETVPVVCMRVHVYKNGVVSVIKADALNERIREILDQFRFDSVNDFLIAVLKKDMSLFAIRQFRPTEDGD